MQDITIYSNTLFHTCQLTIAHLVMWASKAHLNMDLFLTSDTNKNPCHCCYSIHIHIKLLVYTVGVIYNSYITLDRTTSWIWASRQNITLNNTFLILHLQSRIKNVWLKVILCLLALSQISPVKGNITIIDVGLTMDFGRCHYCECWITM